MLKEDHAAPAVAPTLPAGSGGPHWRALLEDRWRTRLQEVTELSLAYHQAAAAADNRDGDAELLRAQRLVPYRRCSQEARRHRGGARQACLGQFRAL